MLAKYLQRIATDYTYERAKPFTSSKFAKFVREDVALEARKQLTFSYNEIKVKASVGQGNWAAVPWIAFFDPLITSSATRGFYVVYLINPDAQTIALSMNQGTTAIVEEYGHSRGLQVLRRQARDIADRVHEYTKQFSEDAIQLGSDAALPQGYEAGHAFGRVYQISDLNEHQVIEDLRLMLEAYDLLIQRGGTTPSEVMQTDSGFQDIEEARKYVLSRRIERSPLVRKAVLQSKPMLCECCGLDPKIDYAYSGPPLETPLDVHHAVPLHGLAEGERRRFKVPEDFIVLCPTCHRMIHKQKDVSDVQKLRKNIRFKIAREISFLGY